MSGERQSFLSNSLHLQAQNADNLKMTVTIFISVHWGAPQEQTSARVTESLCKHHQSLPVVWLIFNSKCDHCRESLFSKEELIAHIESVHKSPTRLIIALNWNQLRVKRRKSFEEGKTDSIVILIPILVSPGWRQPLLPKFCAKKVNFELISAKKKRGRKRC